jgi:hypothetical protein
MISSVRFTSAPNRPLTTRHAIVFTRDVTSPKSRPNACIRSAGRHIAAAAPGMVVAHVSVMHSSHTRGKIAFMPWMAALVLGATAHAGWMIHELRHRDAQPLIVEIDTRPYLADHERSRSHPPARCRHAPIESPAAEPIEPFEDFDLWVQQTARYVYAIDRRMLDQLALTQLDARTLERLQGLGDRARGAVELRNIRRGTPLYLLGLRNGDRVLAIATRGQPRIERVAVTIERRGQPLALVYEII